VENLTVCRRTARFLRRAAAPSIASAAPSGVLARKHEFARKLANTGRMAQANAYPPCAGRSGRALGAERRRGRHDADAVPRHGHALPRPRLFGADAATLARLDELAALFPIDFRAVDPPARSPATSAPARARSPSCAPTRTSPRWSGDASFESVAAALRDALGSDERARLAAAA
jgi:hypothetical protein